MNKTQRSYKMREIKCTWNSRLTFTSSRSSGDLGTGSIRHEQNDLNQRGKCKEEKERKKCQPTQRWTCSEREIRSKKRKGGEKAAHRCSKHPGVGFCTSLKVCMGRIWTTFTIIRGTWSTAWTVVIQSQQTGNPGLSLGSLIFHFTSFISISNETVM